MRGHGRSIVLNDGLVKELNTESMNHLKNDLSYFLKSVDTETDVPTFIVFPNLNWGLILVKLSQSYAGLLVLSFASDPEFTSQHQINGVIVSGMYFHEDFSRLATALEPAFYMPFWKYWIMQAMAFFMPDYLTESQFHPTNHSLRSAEWIERKAQDPYNFKKQSSKSCTNINNT